MREDWQIIVDALEDAQAAADAVRESEKPPMEELRSEGELGRARRMRKRNRLRAQEKAAREAVVSAIRNSFQEVESAFYMAQQAKEAAARGEP